MHRNLFKTSIFQLILGSTLIITMPSLAKTCPPLDQGLQDLDFVQFRTELLQIAARKDLNTLLRYVSPEIQSSYGEEATLQNFLLFWKLNTSPQTSEFWQEFTTTLSLGGQFWPDETGAETHFSAPYTFSCAQIQDAYSEKIVMGKNIALRQFPDIKATVLATLNFEVVQTVPSEKPAPSMILNGESHSWYHVKLSTGQQGYIWGKYLRSPIDFRAGFEKKSGKWKLHYFVAGD